MLVTSKSVAGISVSSCLTATKNDGADNEGG